VTSRPTARQMRLTLPGAVVCAVLLLVETSSLLLPAARAEDGLLEAQMELQGCTPADAGQLERDTEHGRGRRPCLPGRQALPPRAGPSGLAHLSPPPLCGARRSRRACPPLAWAACRAFGQQTETHPFRRGDGPTIAHSLPGNLSPYGRRQHKGHGGTPQHWRSSEHTNVLPSSVNRLSRFADHGNIVGVPRRPTRHGSRGGGSRCGASEGLVRHGLGNDVRIVECDGALRRYQRDNLCHDV
jgi:hypothetical protein